MLPELQHGVNSQEFADEDLALLQEFRQLEWLDLHGTRITDAGLAHLKSLTNLRLLDVQHTRVTSAGVELLQRELPECDIRR